MAALRMLFCTGFLGLLCACSTAPRETNVLNNFPEAPLVGEPDGLTGLDPAAVRVAYGAPALIRKDGKAEIWRYDHSDCRAFFFFYPAGNGFALRHVETIPRGRDIAADRQCLARLHTAPTS